MDKMEKFNESVFVENVIKNMNNIKESEVDSMIKGLSESSLQHILEASQKDASLEFTKENFDDVHKWVLDIKNHDNFLKFAMMVETVAARAEKMVSSIENKHDNVEVIQKLDDIYKKAKRIVKELENNNSELVIYAGAEDLLSSKKSSEDKDSSNTNGEGK